MVTEIYLTIKYLFSLTYYPDVLWLVFPLIVATVVMLVYFEKYRDERPGWNTHVENSLVLFFVSLYLLRQIYSVGNAGLLNFVFFPEKTVVSAVVLLVGVVLLLLNFEHFLPEKVANNISSPLTTNLFAYIIVLYVYSSSPQPAWIIIVSLILLFTLLLAILNLIKIPFQKLFSHLRKLKEKEKFAEVLQEKRDIQKKKTELLREQKKFLREKREITKVEAKVKKKTLKDAVRQKKQSDRLKKLAKS